MGAPRFEASAGARQRAVSGVASGPAGEEGRGFWGLWFRRSLSARLAVLLSLALVPLGVIAFEQTRRLEAELDRVGPHVMHERLRKVDPVAAGAILASNGRRIVRALEVVTLSGRPFVASLPQPCYVHTPTVQVAIDVPRAELDLRVARRAERMWQAGFVDEVRGLLDQGLQQGRTASRALGYAQLLGHLDGQWSQEEARERTIAATRRFVRRQDAWFRRDARVTWLAPGPELVDDALAVVRAGSRSQRT